MHLPTVKPRCGQTEGGGQLREARGRNTAASSLSWCKLTTSPLQAVTTMTTRPVTLKMKWVQGPTSKGSSFYPHCSQSVRLHSKFVVSLLKAPRNCSASLFLSTRKFLSLGFQFWVFLTALSNLGEGLEQTKQGPGAPGPSPPIAHHALQKSSNGA